MVILGGWVFRMSEVTLYPGVEGGERVVEDHQERPVRTLHVTWSPMDRGKWLQRPAPIGSRIPLNLDVTRKASIHLPPRYPTMVGVEPR